jgi:hypothetical protein
LPFAVQYRISVPQTKRYHQINAMNNYLSSSITLKTPEAVEITPEKLKDVGPNELSGSLEHAKLIYFPTTPVAQLNEDDIRFLRDETPAHNTSKNVSYYPLAGRVTGIGGPRELRDRVNRILKEHHDRVEQFLKGAIPSLASGWTSGSSSLRAFQEKDRDLPLRGRSDLIHLDAGAYGVTRGDLILRFLTNLDNEDRVWRVKGTVADLVEKYGSAAGLQRGDLLHEGTLDRLYSTVIRGLSTVTPMARSLGRSAYDVAMRRMHNYMKESETFQRDPEGARDVNFRPGSCWLVFADMVGHACMWGRLSIIDTFIVPKENFRDCRYTPYEVLRRYERGEQCVLEDEVERAA